MKSNPVAGGSLKSKPTWSNAFGCSATSAFLFSVVRHLCNQQGESDGKARSERGGSDNAYQMSAVRRRYAFQGGQVPALWATNQACANPPSSIYCGRSDLIGSVGRRVFHEVTDPLAKGADNRREDLARESLQLGM